MIRGSPPPTAPVLFYQGERGVPGVPGDHGEKGEPGESVIGPPVSMMVYRLDSLRDSLFGFTYDALTAVLIAARKESSPNVEISVYDDENVANYHEVVEFHTTRSHLLFSHMPYSDSSNLTDLIAREWAFIFEIQDCRRQGIDRAKGV